MNNLPVSQPERDRPAKRPAANANPILRLFGSIWFGIFLLSLLFIYCSVGSALPAVRQLPALEMTEFEWFHWWPFDVLVALFCINMTVVTVQRIPFRLVNYGVWTIHTGIVVLVLGSYIYFGTKVEGDTAVFRRQVVIQVPGASEAREIVALPGNKVSAAGDGGTWHFEVFDTNTEAEALNAANEVVKAYEVSVMVTPPEGERFLRYLYAGLEDFTRDLIPGMGFASNAIGRRLVKEDLSMRLAYQPTTTFHVMDTWALYVRRRGDGTWVQRPISGLPRYNDRIGSRDMVFLEPGSTLPLRPIDLEVPPPPGGDVLSEATVRITGYLRYAQMRQQWREGASFLNPVLQFTALVTGGESQGFELVALDPNQNTTPGGGAEFIWLEDKSQLADLPTNTTPQLDIEVTATGKKFSVAIGEDAAIGRDGPFLPIEGTDFKYRIVAVPDRLTIPGSERTVSVAMVEVESPEGRFTRMVADQPGMTKDLHSTGDEASADPHGRTSTKPDERLTMTYTPSGPRFMFVGHPDGSVTFIHNGAKERLDTREVHVGETIRLEQGAFRIDDLLTNAKREVKPYIVPKSRRRRNMGEIFSMIRLEIGSGARVESHWVPFNQYAFPDDQFRYSGRFAYEPIEFSLADGRRAEVLFSRRQLPLPHPVALDSFELDEHAGGYSGSVATIRNYLSSLRFLDQGRWSEPIQISVNSPTENGGYWYFQSTWDPPRGKAGGGMNYTGLGVGNRNGVYIQLAGSCIAVAGMFFAFYIKPILRRRRAQLARAKVARSESTADETMDESEPQETAPV
ncbi:MAG: hypothetical protein ACE5E5_09365 [Phycisphaerae bacterium]